MRRLYKLFLVFYLVVIFFITSFSCFSASAEKYSNFSITLPDGYSVYTDTDDFKSLAEFYGKTEGDIKYFFDDNQLKLFAHDSNDNVQVKLSVYSDEFSKKTVDFSNLKKKEVLGLAESIFENCDIKNENATKVAKKNGSLFLKNNSITGEIGNKQVVTQYVTVSNCMNYVLTINYRLFVPESVTNEIFDTFSVGADSSGSNFLFVVALIGMLFFAAVAVILTIGLVKRLRKKDDKTDCEKIDIQSQKEVIGIKTDTDTVSKENDNENFDIDLPNR